MRLTTTFARGVRGQERRHTSKPTTQHGEERIPWGERRTSASQPQDRTGRSIAEWWGLCPIMARTHISLGLMNANTHLVLSTTVHGFPCIISVLSLGKERLGVHVPLCCVVCMVCECQTKSKMTRHLKWLVTTICCWLSNVMMEVTIIDLEKEFNTARRCNWPLWAPLAVGTSPTSSSSYMQFFLTSPASTGSTRGRVRREKFGSSGKCTAVYLSRAKGTLYILDFFYLLLCYKGYLTTSNFYG